MAYKQRTEPRELTVMRILNSRMELSPEEQYYFQNLKKGYEGELKFDDLAADLDSRYLVLHDIRLEVNNSEFQIDSLIITQDMIIPCDIKNQEGNYSYREGNFYKEHSKTPITNPLHQLNRCKSLFQQYLQKNGFHFPIEGYLIYVNAEFFLYNAPQNEPIIFLPQIPKFLSYIKMKPANLNGIHIKLADLLIREHIPLSKYAKIPSYKFGNLQKGLTCRNCGSFSLYHGKKKLVCNMCGNEETIESAILHSVNEIKLLFPEMKITTNLVYDWLAKQKCKQFIRKILKKHYDTKGFGRWLYYE